MKKQFLPLVAVLGVCALTRPLGAGEAALSTVRVAQDGSGDFNGADETPILEAIDRVGTDGGVIVIGPGRYLIRRPLSLGSSVVLRGTAETVLQLPAPVLVKEPAAKGERVVETSDVSQFTSQTTIELFPPSGAKYFADGKTESFRAEVASISDGRLHLAEPLPHDVPKDGRLGYPHNMVVVSGPSREVTIEQLTFDGGRNAELPIPGHHRRSGIWAHGRYSYEEGPLGPPVAELRVRNCTFRNCYGRGVAMYSVVDSEVTDCRFEQIADEAIDFDHFCLRCKAVDNQVAHAVIGVTLNDASHCLVERNRLTGCSRGIVVWWWYRCPQEGLNEHNTIQHNVIESPRGKGISLGKRCHHNVVRHNSVTGGIEVVESTNTVEDNTIR